ncbi:hypothetical protein TNCV_813451 [Trichonephila clavipes]|nr:hypothetical protein TNCV_813451 [Trichonephila clavipes]
MILTSRRRHFYLVGQSKHKLGACGVNNQASAVLAGNELPFVAFRSAAEEKRTGDDKKVIEIEESIHCILNRLWQPDVEIDHFSNSIIHTVVYGQLDSYGEVFLSLDTLDI